MKIARWVLPAIAIVALVGTACTPVKSQPGKNILAYTIGNGCLPGLGDGQDKSNSTRVGANQSREVCTNGFAGNQVSGVGVTLQVVNDGAGDPTPNTRSSAGFVTGGLNQLGQIGAIKVTATGGSSPVTVTVVMDKNKDGQFLCPPGFATALCGDAVAVFVAQASVNNGNEYVYESSEPLNIVFFEPCGPPFGCAKGGSAIGQPVSFSELQRGKFAGIGGDTPTVLSFSSGPAPAGTDTKATVTGVEVNGQQFLP